MSPEENKTVVRRFVEKVFNKGKLHLLPQLAGCRPSIGRSCMRTAAAGRSHELARET